MHIQISPRNTSDSSSSIQNHQTMTRHVMSLRESSGQISKRRDHVMCDIRRMLARLEITAPKFGASHRNETGAARAAYLPFITPKGLACLAENNIGASL